MILSSSQQGPGHPAAEINTREFNELAAASASRAASAAASFLPGGKICRLARAKAGLTIASQECGLYERLTFQPFR
jgi:hypothetical protein